MQAERNADWSLDHKDGMEKAFCCFYSNARDFARIGKLYSNLGNFNGKQILSSSFVEESLRPAPLLSVEGEAVTHYGLHWWLMKRQGYDLFYARGILGQYIIGIPELKLIIVRLGHKRGEKLKDYHMSDVLLYIDGVLEMYATHN